MRKTWVILVLALLGGLSFYYESSAGQPRFEVLCLGAEGGLAESNLTSFLVAERGVPAFVALDAGNLLSGLREAQRKGNLKDLVPEDSPYTPEGWMLKEGIKVYLLSHAHLDHVSGLVINSTDDTEKPIFGLDSTIDYLVEDIFNWEVWPNFGDEGAEPTLNVYSYRRIPARADYMLEAAGMRLRAFQLCHSHCYPSTAFLLEADGEYLLYVGDTGPDQVEGGGRLDELWTAVAPLVKSGKLRGIFLECSFPDGRPDELLFGHLTPKWLLHELGQLGRKVGGKKPLAGMPVVVFHIKPSFEKGPTPRQLIGEQLSKNNALGVRFLFPEQGDRLQF